MEIGWIGLGRMGYRMAERMIDAGHTLSVWNRTASKAGPLGAKGARIASKKQDLAGSDVLFTMLSTGKDLDETLLGKDGVIASGHAPKILVDCSSIGLGESAELRVKLEKHNVEFLCAPVSGNPQCVVAGKLSSVVSGPQGAFKRVEELIKSYAVRGVAYVGEGDLARICKIAHNVFLAVVIENLI